MGDGTLPGGFSLPMKFGWFHLVSFFSQHAGGAWPLAHVMALCTLPMNLCQIGPASWEPKMLRPSLSLIGPPFSAPTQTAAAIFLV